MRRSTPRSWSRRRLIRGLAWPAAACVVAAIASVDAVLVGVLLVGYAALDGLLFRIVRPLRRDALALHLAPRAPEEEQGFVTGGAVLVDVELRGPRALGEVLVTPLVPPALEVERPEGVVLPLDEAQTARVTFRFSALQPGEVVLLGVLVRAASPLRLFERTLLLVQREVLSVGPDYQTTADPRLLHFFRSTERSSDSHVGRRRGLGTDFAELRPYRYPDPLGHVDWKATARRSELIVREYEEPRDVSIDVFLDASPDLTHVLAELGGYGNAADLVAKLAHVAAVQGIALSVTAYDRGVAFSSSVSGGLAAARQLMAELMAAPRRGLIDTARARGGDPELGRLAAVIHERTSRRWRGFDRAESPEEFLRRIFGDDLDVAEAAATFLADMDPGALYAVQQRCPQCHTTVFPDEVRCLSCGWAASAGPLPRRAECLVELLEAALRRGRGRRLLLLVTSLQGGEASAPVVDLLRLAASAPGSVHVAVPTYDVMMDWRPKPPGSLADSSDARPVLRDIEKLSRATRFLSFRDELAEAGVFVHRLDRRESLDDMVAELLFAEVLTP